MRNTNKSVNKKVAATNQPKQEDGTTKFVVSHFIKASDSKSDVTSLQILNNDSKLPSGYFTPIIIDETGAEIASPTLQRQEILNNTAEDLIASYDDPDQLV